MDGKKYAQMLLDKWKTVVHGQKSKLLFFIGIAGMCFILLSAVVPSMPKENPQLGGETFSTEQYVSDLESRLGQLIGSIDGVGRCEVMVTVENDVEYVYAVEQTQNRNETNRYEGEEITQQSQQENTEQKYIVLDSGSGKKEALLRTRRQPTIQGVVVVCEGAGNMVVQERVTQAVTTALGIPYNKVCVTKIGQ